MIIDPRVERPLPLITDPWSREYFTAWAEQRLLVQRCTSCEHWQHYPRALCEECGGVPAFHPQAAVGSVYTFTIIRQMGVEPFRSEVPYAVVMVEIECGVKIMGALTDCDVDDVAIGMQVEGYGIVIDDIGIPYWRPRGDSAVAGATTTTAEGSENGQA